MIREEIKYYDDNFSFCVKSVKVIFLENIIINWNEIETFIFAFVFVLSCLLPENLKLPTGLIKLCNFVNKYCYYYILDVALTQIYIRIINIPR